jgi:hypothetical protein
MIARDPIDQTPLRTAVIGTAVASGLFSFLAMVMLMAATAWKLDMAGGPSALLEAVAPRPTMVRWWFLSGMLADLLLLPTTVLLYHWLRDEGSDMVGLYTVSGIGYVLTRATANALLAVQAPILVSAFRTAETSAAGLIRRTFIDALNEYAARLDLAELLGGVWLLGIGLGLRRLRRGLGLLTIVFGSLELIVGLGSWSRLLPGTGPHFIARLLLAPVWAITMGIGVAKHSTR